MQSNSNPMMFVDQKMLQTFQATMQLPPNVIMPPQSEYIQRQLDQARKSLRTSNPGNRRSIKSLKTRAQSQLDQNNHIYAQKQTRVQQQGLSYNSSSQKRPSLQISNQTTQQPKQSAKLQKSQSSQELLSKNKAKANAREGKAQNIQIEVIKEFEFKDTETKPNDTPAGSKFKFNLQPLKISLISSPKENDKLTDSSSKRDNPHSKDQDQEKQDKVAPLDGQKRPSILASFQSAYLNINPEKSKDVSIISQSLKNLMFGKKTTGSPYNPMRSSPYQSQKTQGRSNPLDNLDTSISSGPGAFKLAPPSTNEIILRSRLAVVDRMNENLSEDDDVYNDESLFMHSLISTNEIITNQIFERVFLNDLSGIKKLFEGFQTFYDKKKKCNLRDLYKRTCLFYSLFHNNSYDMVEFLVQSGCDTLYLDCKGRTVLHYACILGCDKKIIQFLIDYSKELDQFRAHTKEAMEEFKNRPIKNFDMTPSTQDIMKQIELWKLGITTQPSEQVRGKKKANNCVSLLEYHAMGHQTSKLREYFQAKVDKELLKQQRQAQIFTKEQEELFKRLKFEKKYKKTDEYIESLIQFVNLVDNKGMTALHYCVKNGQEELIKCLVSNQANLLIRDYKLRMPVDCNIKNDQEINAILRAQRLVFEDDYTKMKKSKNTNEVKKSINMFIDEPSRLTTMKFLQKRRLVIDQKNLASKNNNSLEQFIYGLYKDNVLTYLMRINDYQTFDYILKRGVSPLASNENDMNAIHLAIKLEKMNFLSYLLEGDFDGYLNDGFSEEIIQQKYENILAKLNEKERYEKKEWILQSLKGLDRCTLNEGFTPLILALKSEKQEVSHYIMQIAYVRERLRQDESTNTDIRREFSKLEDFIQYSDKKQKTALLTSAQHGHLECFQALFKMGANFYGQCAKLNNALHYGIMSENEKLIQYISWSDAENSTGYGYMHNQRNIRGMIPIDYDRKKRFYDTIYHVWESASILKSGTAFDRLNQLIKNGTYKVNQQTIQGLNTPLHFAVMHENVKAMQALLKFPGIQMNIKNREGKIPYDLAHLIANKTSQFQICNTLQKALSQQFKVGIQQTPSLFAKLTQQASENQSQYHAKQVSINEDHLLDPSPVKQKLQSKNHQKTIMPHHQFTITEHGHLYENVPLKQKELKIIDQDEDLPLIRIHESSSSLNELASGTNTMANKDSYHQDNPEFHSQQTCSPLGGQYTSSKLLDARDILKTKLAEYSEYVRNPHLLVGKFPLEIYKKWFDQYNQMYSNREHERLSELFAEMYASLKDKHDQSIKQQIAMMQAGPLKDGQRNSDAYILGKRQFNNENYLTFKQIEGYIDLITQRFEMSPHEGKLFKDFLPIYYEDTKISIVEFCQNMMNKFRIYQQTKQYLTDNK
ncbi:ankyrin repeat [Stylonychia lemnae]|uniref:Ankyrin repeat n=1 Tax=Stylonychia lemnae TaxID=5949 RepID=A0A078A5T3_STYLE|nr:ankyrin repeat [Stylonychia lemnae]|eukprot:CDW77266.1 ankyrin repeat [Stylonychia lemnae]